MARYLDADAAAADGFTIVHEPERSRFVVQGPAGVVGEAHYTLFGDSVIDFDHTVVDPALRGTGLSGILAHTALTAEVVAGRKISASCWFIAGYLEKHPELQQGD